MLNLVMVDQKPPTCAVPVQNSMVRRCTFNIRLWSSNKRVKTTSCWSWRR